MNTDNEQQLLQNIYGLVNELQGATFLAAKFAKAALEGTEDTTSVMTSGPKAKVVELGLQALDVASRTSQQIHALSAIAIEIANRQNRKELTEATDGPG